MQVKVRNTHEESCAEVAQMIKKLVEEKPNAVLGLATGNTPIKLYDELVRLENAGELDLSQITTFNLDEYSGLSNDHPESYYFFMQKNLFSRLNNPPKPENINIPNGNLSDEETAKHCAEYEAKIASKGIDLQILGIGGEGHIGFNEAGSEALSVTRLVQLAQRTIDDAHEADNGFATKEDVPKTAITMGVHTIRRHSETVVLLANGDGKADIIKRTVEGLPNEKVPASLLKGKTWAKPNQEVVVFADEAAAANLTHLDEYKAAEQNGHASDPKKYIPGINSGGLGV